MEVTCTSSKNRRVVKLPDELVAEILARVPYRSLCQFKCVSRSWRRLCSEPAIRRRCPQTLAGFFFRNIPDVQFVRHFVNASGRGPPMVNPSLSFIPPAYSRAGFLDSCNGLLLCEDVYRYFVCNPLTEKWMALPDPKVPAKPNYLPIFCLCFDPAMSSHFRVFLLETGSCSGLEIFSSETGEWSHRQSGWGDDAMVGWDFVFFNGTLHVTSGGPGPSSLLTVDMDGEVWGRIPTPHDFTFMGVSQGRLHAVQIRNHRRDDESISIWVLEDYAGQQWNLKHTVAGIEMFGGARPRSFGDSYSFVVHAVHPEHGVIFLTVGKERSLMSYDMDKKEVRFIRTLGASNMSTHPYVPCFIDWLSDGH